MARFERLLPPGTDILEFLLALPPEDRLEAVRSLGFTDADALDRDWPTWAHDGQAEPAPRDDGSPWSTWVIMAGRGFGKTIAGSNWVTAAVAAAPGPIRIALVGATLAEARAVMVEGKSGLLEIAGPWIREWRPSLGTLRFRTGAVATLFSGASPEQLRDPEHHIAWCDELAKWEKPGETWDMLQLGLRLGDRPRAIVTTTPRPGPHLRRIMAAAGTMVTRGATAMNPHVSAAWQAGIHDLYAGTRLGRQELGGELLPDTPGALWSVEVLERCRAQASDCAAIANQRGEPASVRQPAPQSGDRTEPKTTEGHLTDSLRDGLTPSPLRGEGRLAGGERGEGDPPDPSTTWVRLVIAVDPPTGDGTCGIIVCAKDAAGRAHVLADHSVTNRTPEGWSSAVADAAATWGHLFTSVPVSVVAEKNQGGAMVRAVLHTADPALKVKLVTATVGKPERAAPVAMLFEAGKVVLHGTFPELEAQLCGMIAGGDYEGPGASPDRADAMVWGLTELMLAPERAPPRVRSL